MVCVCWSGLWPIVAFYKGGKQISANVCGHRLAFWVFRGNFWVLWVGCAHVSVRRVCLGKFSVAGLWQGSYWGWGGWQWWSIVFHSTLLANIEWGQRYGLPFSSHRGSCHVWSVSFSCTQVARPSLQDSTYVKHMVSVSDKAWRDWQRWGTWSLRQHVLFLAVHSVTLAWWCVGAVLGAMFLVNLSQMVVSFESTS